MGKIHELTDILVFNYRLYAKSYYTFNEKFIMFKHNTPVKVIHILFIKAACNEQ